MIPSSILGSNQSPGPSSSPEPNYTLGPTCRARLLIQPPGVFEFFYIYFFMIFEKINGRIKIFEKCTSGAPWSTALGVPPTVGSTSRWGQVRAVVGRGSMIPSAVVRGGRSSSVVAHGGKALAPWATAAMPFLYKGPSHCRRPLPHYSKPSAFNPSEHF
jgi:hypothetical protein